MRSLGLPILIGYPRSEMKNTSNPERVPYLFELGRDFQTVIDCVRTKLPPRSQRSDDSLEQVNVHRRRFDAPRADHAI
jgi:hypothetical protein